MGIVFRQSIKTSLVTFAGAALGMLVVWYSSLHIPKHELGFSRNFTNNAVLLSQFLLAGLNYSLVVYIHHYTNDSKKRNMLLSICFGIPILLTILLFIPYFIFKEQILNHYQPVDRPYISQFYVWLPLYTVLFIMQIMLEQFMGTQMKVALGAFIREIILRVINAAILFLFIAGQLSFDQFIIWTVLALFISFFSMLYVSYKSGKFGISLQLNAFSKQEYRELIDFSASHFLLTTALLLMNSLDVALLPYYDPNGINAVAVYSNALVLLSFLQIPSKAMINSTVNVLSQAFANKDMVKAKEIFTRSSINITVATVLMALIISCNLHNVLELLKHKYDDMVMVFLILLAGRLADLCTGMNDAVLSIAKFYKFNVVLSFILLAILFGSIKIFVPKYGVMGAAACTSVVFILFNFAKYYYVKLKLDMQPFSVNTLKVVVAALPGIAVGYFMPVIQQPLVDGVVRSIAITVVYVAMVLIVKASPDVTHYIQSIKKNKKLF